MPVQQAEKAGGKVPKQDQKSKPDRNERLARQLRANLKKRKQQTRQRETPDEAEPAGESGGAKSSSLGETPSKNTRKD